jgi:hypothetical protein
VFECHIGCQHMSRFRQVTPGVLADIRCVSYAAAESGWAEVYTVLLILVGCNRMTSRRTVPCVRLALDGVIYNQEIQVKTILAMETV